MQTDQRRRFKSFGSGIAAHNVGDGLSSAGPWLKPCVNRVISVIAASAAAAAVIGIIITVIIDVVQQCLSS